MDFMAWGPSAPRPLCWTSWQKELCWIGLCRTVCNYFLKSRWLPPVMFRRWDGIALKSIDTKTSFSETLLNLPLSTSNKQERGRRRVFCGVMIASQRSCFDHWNSGQFILNFSTHGCFFPPFQRVETTIFQSLPMRRLDLTILRWTPQLGTEVHYVSITWAGFWGKFVRKKTRSNPSFSLLKRNA